jgi:hypothetical protein
VLENTAPSPISADVHYLVGKCEKVKKKWEQSEIKIKNRKERGKTEGV